MNAYDIANDLDREGKFPGHVCYGTSPLLVRAANKLREQAAEIGAYKIELELHKAMIQDLERGLESSLALNKALVEKK